MAFDEAFTEADLDEFPDNGFRYEIVDGSLHVLPPASFAHNRIALRICRDLETAAPDGWEVAGEVGVRIPRGNLIADAAVARSDVDDEASWQDPAVIALAVEVESPSSRHHDRTTKLRFYADAGIPSYWRVERHHDGIHVQVYELNDTGTYTHVTWIRPGDTWKATQPFEVEIDPSRWGR